MNFGGLFDVDKKLNEIKKLEKETQKVNFWQNQKEASIINEKLSNLKEDVNDIASGYSKM